MSDVKKTVCQYRKEGKEWNYSCGRRTVNNRDYCLGHSESGISSSNLKKLIEEKDGEWTGFKLRDPITLSDIEIDFPICARAATIKGLDLSNVSFKEDVDFTSAIFEDNFELKDKTTFEKNADFSEAYFNCPVRILRDATFCGAAKFSKARFGQIVELTRVKFNMLPVFNECEFKGPFIARGAFSHGGNFNSVVFHSVVKFLGARDIDIDVSFSTNVETLSEDVVSSQSPISIKRDGIGKYISYNINRYWQIFFRRRRSCLISFKKTINEKKDVFLKWFKNLIQNVRNRLGDGYGNAIPSLSGPIDFTDVEFLTPEKVTIQRADFRKAYIRGTNFSEVKLIDVNWYQKKLRRNGIYDDVSALETPDWNFKRYINPEIETQYRHLRSVLEANKDFLAASDFYVGEMDYRLKRLGVKGYFFSIIGWYKLLSGYATKPVRAIIAFFFLLTLYVLISASISGDFSHGLERYYSGFSLMTLKASANTLGIEGVHQWLDLAFRIIGPFQLALIALSIRNKVKRN
ncbi:pentapeptide repeat-containing protein [Luteithermobacter gelatinilyticus]|uniref:pentapeptide repeat-containing protein n=1 Tax=Luteithermobacter gelatinilyticus TaxID=2582913 RepID=UPI001106BC43|nr:pentapeptide repeat-containing protein [Luteithermobacter gelatinilyticus]